MSINQAIRITGWHIGKRSLVGIQVKRGCSRIGGCTVYGSGSRRIETLFTEAPTDVVIRLCGRPGFPGKHDRELGLLQDEGQPFRRRCRLERYISASRFEDAK